MTHALPQNMEHSSGTSIRPSAPRPLPNLQTRRQRCSKDKRSLINSTCAIVMCLTDHHTLTANFSH